MHAVCLFVFDVICSVRLQNGYVIVLKSASHRFLNYSPPLPNAFNMTKTTGLQGYIIKV